MSCNPSNADFRPANYNIQIWQNNTWSQVLLLTANTIPINLTGAIVEIQIRTKPTSTTALLTLTIGHGLAVGGVNFNQITINQAVSVAAGNYVYDLTIQFPNQNVKTYIWGNFIVFQDITQL